jgi:hypothetical protein
MKKNLLTVCICAILATFTVTSFAQKLSFGEYTGINFSNLHGNLTSNKWVSKTGPSAGLSVEYNLGRLFSVQTEIGFINLYYEMKSYDQKYSYPIVYPMDDVYHGYSNTWYPVSEPYNFDFSFLRFPLLIKYKTPTRLQLGIGAGVFYSVLLNDKLAKAERNAAEKDNHNIYPPTHDWGYIVSADLSYPVTNNLKLYLAGRLTTGQKVFIESYKAKNGASELNFGLKYTPQRKSIKSPISLKSSARDSSITRCYIIPATGVIMSWNSSGTKPGNYSGKFGPNVGMIFGYRLDKSVSLQTGIIFDRKGYALNDTSLYFHRFALDSRYVANKVDTKIALDYLTVPLNFRISSGNAFNFYVDFGAYAGFLVNAFCHGTAIRKNSDSYSYTIQKTIVNDAVEGYYKSVDWGYKTGVGFQFPFRDKMKFDMGISYYGSFNPILQKPDANTTNYTNDDLSIKNGSFSLHFGIQIPIAN